MWGQLTTVGINASSIKFIPGVYLDKILMIYKSIGVN